MLFYKIIVKSKNIQSSADDRRSESYAIGHPIAEKCDFFNIEIVKNGNLFLCNASRGELTFGLILYASMDAEKTIRNFVQKNHIPMEKLDCREITFSIFRRLLSDASRRDFIMDDQEILEELGLEPLTGFGLAYDEKIFKDITEEEIYIGANKFFAKETLNPELDRIFAEKKKKRFCGHPVHYIIRSDNSAVQIGMAQLLLKALYQAGRIETRRYTKFSTNQSRDVRKKNLESLYLAASGGAIIIGHEDFDHYEEDDLADGNLETLISICELSNCHRRDVLTIFCLPKTFSNLKGKIYENMAGCTFVEIDEELAYGDRASEYLKMLAVENKIRSDKSLLDGIEEGRGYLSKELNEIFNEWYGRKLKTQVFKQYKDFESVKKEVKEEKPKGSAYEELSEMIGLTSAKTVITQALDNYKALKIFKDKGIKADETSRHMIFTGNPGTAKTTVARLFARIMKENGLVSSGQLIEVGRGDLVGRYVGWTAQIIQKKFKEAKGGILFIDEAYSLVDDRDGSYGDEAINAIVQEMENNRDDVIVIFAGYPDKMEGFMQKNPGLRSRIAFHVNFEDYSPDELCRIAELIAKKKGVELDESAMTKLHGIMETASSETDFGNGRYVRNIIENAKRAQSSRLLKMDLEAVTTEDVRTICAEDISEPFISAKKPARVIGFAV